MDSLTQIVLGAAVGEVTLGKKIGNRALLWGGVAGTIPDLDVFVGGLFNPLVELASHRGFSHSITFAVIGAILLGWIVKWMYASSYHRYIAFLSWFLLPAGVIYFLGRIFRSESSSVGVLIGQAFVLLAMTYWLYRRYFRSPINLPEASLRDWQRLFFWGLFTHPLLDCFTTYGTQLFSPFSNYRVAFNAVSVADPIYTVPFLLLVIAVSYFSRGRVVRRKLAWAGIGISSAYLLFAVINKQRINAVFKQSLADSYIHYDRYMTSPTILNNLLWSCLAMNEEGFYHGYYSIFDHDKKVQLSFTPHHKEYLVNEGKGDPTIETLDWFSNGYWAVTKDDYGKLQVNDMRFGTMIGSDSDEETYYIFNFPLEQNANGDYILRETRGGPPPGKEDRMLGELWKRIKGI